MIRRRPELDTEHLPGQIVNRPEYTIGDYVKNIEESITKEEKSFGQVAYETYWEALLHRDRRFQPVHFAWEKAAIAVIEAFVQYTKQERVGGSLVPKDVWEQIGASLGEEFDPKR